MNRLRTLHIDSEMQWGGGQRQVSALCSYLREQGHDVRILCRPSSKLGEWAKREQIEVRAVDMRSSMDVAAVLKMRSLIAEYRPDVVHLHASRAHVLGSAAAKLAGSRTVIATRRNADPVHLIWPNKSAYGSWTRTIVAISSAVRESLIASGVQSGHIHVIESGADIEAFASAQSIPSFRAQIGADEHALLVGTAATLMHGKGVNYLLEAASILKIRGENVHIVIAGDGEARAELEDLASQLNVDASFLGFQSDMPSVIASLDVFAMPSLAEGLGTAVIEAMAAAKPVVASGVGGLCESVVDGQTGFLIPPANSEVLADKIRVLLANSELRQRFGCAGQARVRQKFSLTNMARGNEALYFELVNG